MLTTIFSFGEQILPNYGSRDVGLSNSMARPMKLKCCMINKVFLVNHCLDIILIVVSNGYALVTLTGA